MGWGAGAHQEDLPTRSGDLLLESEDFNGFEQAVAKGVFELDRGFPEDPAAALSHERWGPKFRGKWGWSQPIC